MVRLDVVLKDFSGKTVAGVVRSIDYAIDPLVWYCNWFPKMWDLNMQPLYPDSHWDVLAIWAHFEQQPDYEILVVEADGQIQAYGVWQPATSIGTDQLQGGHIAFLATAPWNRNGAPSALRNLGKLLVAICSLGGLRRINSGVLELESLPTAEPAYVKMGFSMTGLVKNQLNHFRLSGPSVFVLVGSQLQFIQKGGVL